VALGAQNCHWEEQGAFTGEISAAMLAELGCRWVLIGHSERRHVFRETDEEINRKVGAALRHGMRPVLCVGETEGERRQGLTFTVVEGQLRAGWAGLSPDDLARCVLAYEPVWAIGTGVNATPGQAAEVHGYLRGLVSEVASKELAQSMRILYGGSVKPDNLGAHSEPDIDGALVRGARLQAPSFITIARSRPPGAAPEGVDRAMFIAVVILIVVCFVIVGLVLLRAGKGPISAPPSGAAAARPCSAPWARPPSSARHHGGRHHVHGDLVRALDDGPGGAMSVMPRPAAAPAPATPRRRPPPPATPNAERRARVVC
jgi:triosephosphate isomerase